jgi:hypothetical protein
LIVRRVAPALIAIPLAYLLARYATPLGVGPVMALIALSGLTILTASRVWAPDASTSTAHASRFLRWLDGIPWQRSNPTVAHDAGLATAMERMQTLERSWQDQLAAIEKLQRDLAIVQQGSGLVGEVGGALARTRGHTPPLLILPVIDPFGAADDPSAYESRGWPAADALRWSTQRHTQLSYRSQLPSEAASGHLYVYWDTWDAVRASVTRLDPEARKQAIKALLSLERAGYVLDRRTLRDAMIELGSEVDVAALVIDLISRR